MRFFYGRSLMALSILGVFFPILILYLKGRVASSRAVVSGPDAHFAAAVPAPLLYQGLRRKAMLQLPRPATVAAGVVRTLHWAGVATGSEWAGALPLEGVASLYSTACGGAPPPSWAELAAAVAKLQVAGRVTLRNSSQLYIGPHFASRVVVALVWSSAPLAELVLLASGSKPPSVLNLGAGHYSAGDATADPTYELLQAHPGAKSVLVEANAESLAQTVGRLIGGGARGIIAVPALITPDTIVGVLSSVGAPTEPDLLKIDIDGFDCAVVETLLNAGFRPALIAVEVNPDFPPPCFLKWDLTRSSALQLALQASSGALRRGGWPSAILAGTWCCRGIPATRHMM